jgi:HK97 family phage prohead protease
MTKLHLGAAIGLLATSACVLTRDPSTDPDERRQPMAGFQGERFLGVAPGSYDAKARTIEATLATTTQVKRYFFTEELEISADAVDLGRAAKGMCPLLDAHNQRDIGAVIGTLSNVRIEADELVGTLTFGETDAARTAEGMVARGELKGISIGYRVNTWTIISEEDGHETWRATRWELLEVSLVPVPADANAGVRAAVGPTPSATITEEEDDMRRNLTGGASTAAIAAATAAALRRRPPPLTTRRAPPRLRQRTPPPQLLRQRPLPQPTCDHRRPLQRRRRCRIRRSGSRLR